MTMASMTLPRRTAAMTPAMTPTTNATTKPSSVIVSVTLKWETTAGATAELRKKDCPKSPWSTPLSHFRYWTGSGKSSPIWALS